MHAGATPIDKQTRRFVEKLLASQRDLTFATVRPDGYPQTNTVSYASEGLTLYFATGRYSQKVRNLEHSAKASITVNAPRRDGMAIQGVSMGGKASVLPDGSDEVRHAADLLARKFPQAGGPLVPADVRAIAYVRFIPRVISLVDFRRGPSPAELVEVAPDEDA